MTSTETARGRVKVETGAKRVRGYVGGEVVFDTVRPLLVWEVPYYPAYYVPAADVRAQLNPTGATEHSPSRGTAEVLDLVTERATVADAARRYPDSPLEDLRDAVRFRWDALDEWLEEDEPVYGHPRDPYKRVDILHSSRTVRVEVDGVVVAESHKPTILFETGLPPRYYLPLSDVRTDLLEASPSRTLCPYKGWASYWHLAIDGRRYPDLVWCYRTTFPESQKIVGLAAFYNEKVDIFVDGEPQGRPRTPFS
jgi:uncharacterized protein (DUF427 family)